MILILASQYDLSTDQVIDWLLHNKKKFIRINESDRIKLVCCRMDSQNSDWLFEVISGSIEATQMVDLRNIHSYWYRRGEFNTSFEPLQRIGSLSTQYVIDAVEKFTKREEDYVYKMLLREIEKRNGIGSYFDNMTNKLENLVHAANCGLGVPATIVTNRKAELVDFCAAQGRVITKGIVDNSWMAQGVIEAWTLTNEITQDILETMGDNFGLSVFQQYIEKYCELRVFYVKGEMKCAAIFSQSNPKTIIDFRNYDHAKPNRQVPFKLPKDIQNAIRSFMSEVSMNCGSLDIILSSDYRYIFLEVNPVGQFGAISRNCNFNLEKMIADSL